MNATSPAAPGPPATASALAKGAPGRRRLKFEEFEPHLPPGERCPRFMTLPEHQQLAFWLDLARAVVEERRAEQERSA